MFDFLFGNKKVLGVDIGTATLKIVELELRNGKPFLSNYAWASIPETEEGSGGRSVVFKEEDISKTLKKMLEKSGIKGKKCFMSIPSVGALVTLINFPQMPMSDMDQAIKFEAHKYIPTDLDDVSISWEVVDGEDSPKKTDLEKIKEPEEEIAIEKKSQNKVQVLLAAASKAKIISYEKIAKGAGLKLEGIEIESLSIANALVGNDRGGFILVDIGAKICNILYVKNGIIRVNRNVDAGGGDFTRAISRGIGVSLDKAEDLKVSGNDFFGREYSMHFSALDLVLSEIKRIIELIPSQEKTSQLEAIILSGGASELAGLRKYLEENIGVRVMIGNPMGRIECDKEVQGLVEKIKGRFSVSLGLALKGIEEKMLKK